jgi:rubredoxin
MPEGFVPVSTGCPVCFGRAELEEEDGLRKWACTGCGYEFGYSRLGQVEETCSLGIPEAVRADLMFRQLSETQQSQPGPLLIVTGDSIPVGRPE